MKLQGILILRIADLMRFFDFGSLWRQRLQFITAVNRNYGLFFDTLEQRLLYTVVRDWFQENSNACVRIEDSVLFIGPDRIHLGEQLAAIDAILVGKLSSSSRAGLIALLKLVGLDDPRSEIRFDLQECLCILRPELEDFARDYIPRTSDCSFRHSAKLLFPLKTKTIVNHGAQAIVIEAGSEQRVPAGGCVVGLFHEETCCRLLPSSGGNGSVELRIVFDKSHQRTDLLIRDRYGEQTVEDVVSFYVEQEGYAYIHGDGRIEVPSRSLNDLLYPQMQQWLNHRVLSLSKTSDGLYYALTTTTKI